MTLLNFDSSIALADGRRSLIGTLGLLDTSGSETLTLFDRILAMRGAGVDEIEAANRADVELTPPLIALFLMVFLEKWGVPGARTLLTFANELREHGLPNDQDPVVGAVLACAEPLARLEIADGDAKQRCAASIGFRALAELLEKQDAAAEAQACAFSSGNFLRADDPDAIAVAELAIRLSDARDDTDGALLARVKLALALRAASEADPARRIDAFDAIEAVLRHASTMPDVSERFVPALLQSLPETPYLAALGPLAVFACAPSRRQHSLPAGVAHLELIRDPVWDLDQDTAVAVLSDVAKVASLIEDARLELEPSPRAEIVEAKWSTWSFEHPTFTRAIPHSRSLKREEGLHELVLIVAHEVIHVLSMMSGVGRAVMALRAAMLDIELALWVHAGCADIPPEELLHLGLAPLEDGDGLGVAGDLAVLGLAEQALEIARKVQVLQDVWAPWYEGIAVFGELSAEPVPGDDTDSTVTGVITNLLDVSIGAEAHRLGVSRVDAARHLSSEGEALHAAAIRSTDAGGRMRDYLDRSRRKYLPGYLAVRSVVSAWRQTLDDALPGAPASRLLMHVTRYGTEDAVPHLGLPVREFGEAAIERMVTWAQQIAAIPATDLRAFLAATPDSGHVYGWRDGRLYLGTQDDTSERVAQADAQRVAEALSTLAGENADTTRVAGAAEECRTVMSAVGEWLSQAVGPRFTDNEDLRDSVIHRPPILPIGEIGCPFWLNRATTSLMCVIRATRHRSEDGKASYDALVVPLEASEYEALEHEMIVRRKCRLTLTRVADVAHGQKVPHRRGGGFNYLVFSFGDWVKVETAGMLFDSHANDDVIADVIRRLRPLALLDFESAQLAEGLAGAQRTRAWIDGMIVWHIAHQPYAAERWAQHVADLASTILDRASHRDADIAASALLRAAVGDSLAARLAAHGLDDLGPLDDPPDQRGVAQAIEALRRSAIAPTPSGWLDENDTTIVDVLGPLFTRGPSGWDVSPMSSVGAGS